MFCYTRKRRRKKKKGRKKREEEKRKINKDSISKLKDIPFSGSRLFHLLFFLF